jgi:hypothetical protein
VSLGSDLVQTLGNVAGFIGNIPSGTEFHQPGVQGINPIPVAAGALAGAVPGLQDVGAEAVGEGLDLSAPNASYYNSTLDANLPAPADLPETAPEASNAPNTNAYLGGALGSVTNLSGTGATAGTSGGDNTFSLPAGGGLSFATWAGAFVVVGGVLLLIADQGPNAKRVAVWFAWLAVLGVVLHERAQIASGWQSLWAGVAG